MNSIKQHTKHWEEVKRFNLGANDIASLLNVGFEDPSQVVENKIYGIQKEHDETTQQLLDRGNRYEDIVRKLCAERNKISIIETGLKYHKEHAFITASPDGYCRQGGGYLTEFKVRHEMSHKIPMKYWVQMQVQMEVWNIDRCMYCENVIKEYDPDQYQRATRDKVGHHGIITEGDKKFYWQLMEFKEVYVNRDRAWWNSIIDKIHGYWSLVEQGRCGVRTRTQHKRKRIADANSQAQHGVDEMSKRRAYLEQKDTMIQPYMLGNYIRNDPLLDWLNIYGPVDKRNTDTNFFLSMIRNKNREFNGRMVAHIESLYPGSTYNICPYPFQDPSSGLEPDPGTDLEPHKLALSFETVEKTRAAMAQRVPIIFNPCFQAQVPSYPYSFGGRADMIVLNKYLRDLLQLEDVPDEEDKYSIVAFKYATINLRADKTYLLNNPKQKVYKAHLWLLNSAMGIEQSHVPECAYLLGRKYDFIKRGITYRINNVFEGVGTVDFSEIDSEYEKTCKEALEWIQRVRSDEAVTWDPMRPTGQQYIEMYPNMKNSCDYPWHEYKQEIAHAIKEITLMYRCGPKVREYALTKGITEWTALTPDTIKYNAGKVMDQIMAFVEANNSDAIEPRSLKNTLLKNQACVEFYMDFESIGNMYDDFSTFPTASSKAMIFLIGVVVVDNVLGTKEYVSYLVDSLDHQSERNMVERMLADFKERREQYGQDFSPVYFWSNAENYMLKRAMGPLVVSQEKLVMIDLCKCFREGGFIMPGQMGYGLKEVAKLMHRNGMIKTIWTEDDSNGLNAMVEAIKIYEYRDAETRQQYFKDLIAYNYVDCKVMEEILDYLRNCPDPDTVPGPILSPSLNTGANEPGEPFEQATQS